MDSKGNLYAWGIPFGLAYSPKSFWLTYQLGTLHGTELAAPNDGYSAPGKTANTPMRLDLPVAMRSIR